MAFVGAIVVVVLFLAGVFMVLASLFGGFEKGKTKLFLIGLALTAASQFIKVLLH